MPLEIRELVIKASVGDRNSSASASSETSGGKNSETTVNEIVEKVLEIIKAKNER
ncbi:DUF5908 family protein [Aquimarina agarilytica]|uniref:DUF5908 family protein n=1 Tax=Aquimarina agarilytica TaxID=1087449 RepID=UPI0002EE9F0F|nr:DUF5908 family protein [Aquimarina agarilytica]